ncbi:anti-sigma factor domain-containing protein [Plantibacter sp. YIM 135249]|uniref:anti-sigma factor n=1 Tax=Plantibacter sp. YIM 135249 TaxID=3423918 RepID=UPI003D33F8E8
MTERDDAELLAAGNALHTLTPAEQAQYDRLLAEDETTRVEAAEFEETVAMLDLSAPPVQPSAGLKSSIMASIANLPQLAPVDAPVDASVAAPPAAKHAAPAAPPTTAMPLTKPPVAPATTKAASAAAAAQATPSSPSSSSDASTEGPAARKARSRWARGAITAVVGAAAAVALVLGGSGLAHVLGGGSITQTVALAEINGAPDVQRARVTVDKGAATLVWSGELGKSALLVDGLGPLPSDKVYELWYINDKGAVSAGTFTTGGGTSWRVLEGTMSAGDAVGVTVEPHGGSEQPTTNPVVVVKTA